MGIIDFKSYAPYEKPPASVCRRLYGSKLSSSNKEEAKKVEIPKFRP